MSAISTTEIRIINADAFSERAGQHPTYVFIGKDTPWADEDIPDPLIDSAKDSSAMFEDILALKRIERTNTASVVPRFDWTAGTVYNQFDHRIDMLQYREDEDASKYLKFYVLTDEFNVYKCLCNNDGQPSRIKPTSQQISDFQTADGYTWKYMYSVKASDVFNFFTTSWMPIYTLYENDGSAQWQVQKTAIDGAIHTINLTAQGSGYDPVNLPVITITGDGTGATAVPVVDSVTGAITKINVTSVGKDYTTATVTVDGNGLGFGAQAVAIQSPVGGHGVDARSELGGTYKMIAVDIIGDESGTFPTTSFRRAGLVVDPLSTNLGTQLVLTNTKKFTVGDTLTGGTSGATGQIIEISQNGRIVWLGNVVNNFNQYEVVSNTEGASTSVESVTNGTNIPLVKSAAAASEYKSRTGKIIYELNRKGITRNADQTESLKFVITF